MNDGEIKLAQGEAQLNSSQQQDVYKRQVIYSKYAGTEVKLEDEEFIIVKQNDILAVVE